MAWFEIHIHQTVDTNEVEKKLQKLIKQNTEIMSKVTDIEAKVDALQASLDAEQAQIQTAIDGLNTTIQELRDQISGGTVDNESLDRIATKLDAIKTDLEGTIADTPTEPQP